MALLKNNILFIIPYHKIGGGEKVHLEIMKSLPRKPFVYFPNINKIDEDNPFKNVAFCFCNKRFHARFLIFYFKVVSYFSKCFIFGCNTRTFYHLLPSFRKIAQKIDLTHAFSYPNMGMENFSLDSVKYLDKRIVINKRTFEDYKNLYQSENIDLQLLERFEIIPNGVEIEKFNPSIITDRFKNFTIGFVGRNSAEKRPELFFEITQLTSLNSKAIGDDFSQFKTENKSTIFFEDCNDSYRVRKEFSKISLLIVTSDKEGFPLVVMEAMELGIPVISTDVGSIKEHLIDNVNGFLIPVNFDTKEVSIMIKEISNNYAQYKQLSKSARKHAVDNFDINVFRERYRKIFE